MNNRKVENMLWGLIFILILVCPSYYSWLYCLFCFILFGIYLKLFLGFKKKDSYFDFDTIFLISFSITGFAYPLFIYQAFDPFLPFFFNSFDLNVISKSTLCSTIAGCLYMKGSLSNVRIEQSNKQVLVKSAFILYIAIFCSFLFYFVGGFDYYSNHYAGVNTEKNSLIFQLETIIQCLMLWVTANEFYQVHRGIKKKPSLLFCITNLFLGFLFSVSGNRTTGMILVLPFLYFTFTYYYKLSLSKMFVLLVLAFVAMFAIQVLRSGDDFSISNLSFNSVVSDLIIPSRSNYLVYECISKNGFTFGQTMLGGVVNIIPSLYGTLERMGCNVFEWGSAGYFTSYTEESGGNVLTGLGTTLQADVQLSFGYIGLFIFYYLGRFVHWVHYNLKGGNFNCFILYAIIMGVAVFWVRSELTYPIRLFVWTIFLNKIINYFSKR